MTIYDLMHWKVGLTAEQNALFLNCVQQAVRCAKNLHSDSVSYYLHELESMRRMYNACCCFEDEHRITVDDVDHIAKLVWKVYRKTMRETWKVKVPV